jgi:DNA-binding transcriptional regulator YiaG
MVSNRQVAMLRKYMAEGLTQEAAAAKAGMSVRTARAWKDGPLPSEARAPRGIRHPAHVPSGVT